MLKWVVQTSSRPIKNELEIVAGYGLAHLLNGPLNYRSQFIPI